MRLYNVFIPDVEQRSEKFITGVSQGGLTLRAVLTMGTFDDSDTQSIIELAVGQFVKIDETVILRTDETP